MFCLSEIVLFRFFQRVYMWNKTLKQNKMTFEHRTLCTCWLFNFLLFYQQNRALSTTPYTEYHRDMAGVKGLFTDDVYHGHNQNQDEDRYQNSIATDRQPDQIKALTSA